ncbi:MAG TPA: phage tail protein [Acetobacteraceae bacterium]|nr:phage tail protein [Acetobacteraceae bacterium]
MSGAIAAAASSPIASALGFGDFAAFGGISFMLLGSPDKLSRTFRTNYAKLPLLGPKPVLQATYDDLNRITMGIRLHIFWCQPDDAVGLLDQQRLSHQPAPLVFASGIDFGPAQTGTPTQYVITEMTVTDQWRYAGVAQYIDVDMTLLEFAPTLPVGAPTVTPPAPPAGVIGVPGGLAAILSSGAGIGLPVPTGEFASVAASTIVRAGAP